METLHNSTASHAKTNVKDIVFWDDDDMWRLICKASSASEGWMKSTKAMEIPNAGCLVQVTTQQGDNVAESVVMVYGATIVETTDDSGVVVGRRIVGFSGHNAIHA
jgi:hypothetical protein